jgi:hypothetical protein
MTKAKTKSRSPLVVAQEKNDKRFETLEQKLEKVDKELWKHRQLLKKRVTVECPVCLETFLVWPLESQSYYTSNGLNYHVKCYDKRNDQ